MDGSGGRKELRERLHTRAPSRASNASTAHTQMTSKSANSTSSYPRESTHPTYQYQYHHSHCGKSSIGTRPASRLSGESGSELREPTPSASSFLHERLQRERNERHASKLSVDLGASVGDIRDGDMLNSPIKRSVTSVGRRQRSDDGDDLAKDAGMGARQMEQVRNFHNKVHSLSRLNSTANSEGKTLSTLHKQNFDLKLELYHRREKQAILEERVEKLESQHREVIDLHEGIIRELDMKDDALAEAVTLIVELETRIDELVREREMVRRVEAGGSYRHSASDQPNIKPAVIADTATTPTASTPKMMNLSVPRLTAHVNSLGRVPSFLFEHSQQTENLRNAVLRGRTSAMHMRKVSESSADPSEINRIASPNLSVLSESSFVSIYGAKEMGDAVGLQPPADVLGMDGSHYDRSPTPTMKVTTTDVSRGDRRNADPSQLPTGSPGTPGGGAKLSVHTRPIGNVIKLNSPLQELERLEKQMATDNDTSKQSMHNHNRGTATPTLVKPPAKPLQQGKTKQEKREALQKVLTNYPTHRDFSNPHAFPPTPDTVSSSTLRNQQNFTSSQDSLKIQTRGIPNDGIMSVYDRLGALGKELPYQTSNKDGLVTAFAGHKEALTTAINTNTFPDINQLARSLPPRPHSSAETISSRAKTASLGSDSDSDGGADARSETDSFDYWMRESMKPNRYQTGPSEQRGSGRSTSPDLFSFPADARGWETDVIFGALKGSGYLGSPVSALKRDPIDEMAGSMRTSQTEVFEPPVLGSAPPTPDRRSSLHARTGNTSGVSASGGKFKKHPAKDLAVWIGGRGRSGSIDSAVSSTRAQPQQPGVMTPGRRNHYPPISGQASKGRGLGLNSFFKRSGSDNFNTPSSATEATFPPSPAQLSAIPPAMRSVKPSGRNSVPPPATMPWRAPGVVEDDLQSATPPPIMRSRGMSLLSGASNARAADLTTPQQEFAEMSRPSTPMTVVQTNTGTGGPQGGGKRKWLGLGRIGNSKTRMG